MILSSYSSIKANEKYHYDFFMNGLQDKTCEDVRGYAEKHGYTFNDFWSGYSQTIAYYSYEIGCLDLYYKALSAGVSPIIGGLFGDLVFTIVDESTEIDSNDPNACKNGNDWLTIIKKTGVDMNFRISEFLSQEELIEMIKNSNCEELMVFFDPNISEPLN